MSFNIKELQKELKKELRLRKIQYEYYRNMLLNCEKIEFKKYKLSDVIISLNTGLNPRKFFQLNTEDASNYYITIKNLFNNKIIFTEDTDKINNEALKLCNNRSNLEIGDILFSGVGTVGITALITENPENWNIKEGIYTIKPNTEKIDSGFLLHLLNCTKIKEEIKSKLTKEIMKSITMEALKTLEIELPSLEIQKRIAYILDNFETVCKDLKIGLPAEIEKRQIQYEYYRNMLLDLSEAI